MFYIYMIEKIIASTMLLVLQKLLIKNWQHLKRGIEMDKNQRRLIITAMVFLSFFLITAPNISVINIAAGTPVLARKLLAVRCKRGVCRRVTTNNRCCQGGHPPTEKSFATTDALPNTTHP
jgi:hypothetical protein